VQAEQAEAEDGEGEEGFLSEGAPVQGAECPRAGEGRQIVGEDRGARAGEGVWGVRVRGAWGGARPRGRG
jgi:hypothetical protein